MKIVMTEMETFPEWLREQGLTPETAQAVVMELGVENRKVLEACTESYALRAELLSLAQQKLTFAMYGEFHEFLESCVTPGVIQSASSSSAHIFCSMLDHVGDKLSDCAEKLRLLKSSSAISGVTNAQLQSAHGVSGIRIHNVHSLQPSDSRLHPNSGDVSLVKVEYGQDDDLSALRALGCVSLKEDPVAVPVTKCKADFSAKQHSGSKIGQIMPRHCSVENNIGVLKKQSQYQHSSPLQHQSSFHQHNAKVKRKLSKHKNVLKGEKCNVFSKDFASSLSSVKRRLRLRTREHPHRCSVCGKDFALKSHLKSHMTTHTGERPYKCSVCGKCFSKKDHLKTHMRIHTGERPYKCSVCGKGFSIKLGLKTHMMNHTGERPYKCSVCGKGFSIKITLKRHMMSHTGERPFKCSVCGKRFSMKDHLKRHMRTHTGERPYKCSICGKCFSKKDHLKTHMRIHTGERPYKCSVCGKGFSIKDHLKTHMMNHTGEHPYKCSVCGKGFSQKVAMKIHMKRHLRVLSSTM
uniref:zinc finger protein 391-like isoform X2 n=1 Tax=Myxine glutinosa TaxID=7769 RepID=UPI00358E00E9